MTMEMIEIVFAVLAAVVGVYIVVDAEIDRREMK
jgi:hypothetical protein